MHIIILSKPNRQLISETLEVVERHFELVRPTGVASILFFWDSTIARLENRSIYRVGEF